MSQFTFSCTGLAICLAAVSVLGQDTIPEPRPLGQLTAAQQEEYSRLLREYRDFLKRRDRVRQDAAESDTALKRAEDWLENERRMTSTAYSQREKDFLAENNEKKSEYRRWFRGYCSAIRSEALDREWRESPNGRPALLFVAEKEMERARKKQEAMSRKASEQGVENPSIDAIPEFEGTDEEKWELYKAFMSKRYGDFVIDFDVGELEEAVGIPEELKSDLREQAADGALFSVYATYRQVHAPAELTSLRKENIALVNALNALRPGWQIAEGFETPRETSVPNSEGTSQPGRFAWILVSFVVLVLVLIVVFVRKGVH